MDFIHENVGRIITRKQFFEISMDSLQSHPTPHGFIGGILILGKSPGDIPMNHPCFYSPHVAWRVHPPCSPRVNPMAPMVEPAAPLPRLPLGREEEGLGLAHRNSHQAALTSSSVGRVSARKMGVRAPCVAEDGRGVNGKMP